MELKLRIAAITDEFSPSDLAVALDAMSAIGMTGAELRVVFGKNIMDLTDDEMARAKALLDARGFTVIAIASPILKCTLPAAPEVDTRFQQDMFNAKYTIDDQPALAQRAFGIAKFFGAKVIRVFSYWRTVAPEQCFDAIVAALRDLADQAAAQDLIIGIENEHACNIATAAEAAKLLDALPHPNLMLVWDPANALVSGEVPYPTGYSLLPKDRVVHVHAKDCHLDGHKPVWGPVGTREVDWKGQVAGLWNDGYAGWLSLETHWAGPGGDKFAGSTICGWNLRGLAAM
jgi:sugar phosphate isomerase/epimerase